MTRTTSYLRNRPLTRTLEGHTKRDHVSTNRREIGGSELRELKSDEAEGRARRKGSTNDESTREEDTSPKGSNTERTQGTSRGEITYEPRTQHRGQLGGNQTREDWLSGTRPKGSRYNEHMGEGRPPNPSPSTPRPSPTIRT